MTARTKLATLNGAHTEGGSSPRRRTWSTQERQRIVDAALAPGASVAEVARLNGLNANLVFKWIRRSREGWLDRRRGPRAGLQERAVVIVDETPAFVPVQIFEAPKTAAALPAPVEVAPPKARRVVRKGARRGGMEISLPNGARVAIDADVDAGALRLVLAALGDL
jgi:transposase